SLSTPNGSGATGVLGRDGNGAWQRWFGYQNPPYQLLKLPGDVRVCAGPDRLNVRSTPTITGQILKSLDPETTARAEEFVLTQVEQPGSGQEPSKPGYGWYHLSAPQEGWAYSQFLADARPG